MSENSLTPKEKEQEFFKMIIGEYLKYGSVDEVYKRYKYNLPISYPGFHRLVRNWGIIKAAGPNSKLSEAICFLTTLSQEKIPLEKLYRSMPPSFKVSMSTLHRILHCIKEGVTRRVGSALVISPKDDPNMVLVANDISVPRHELGKPFGAVSLPMGYSKGDEDPKESILRVLQQEVFTKDAIERHLPYIIPNDPRPFAYIDIADVKVAVYQIPLPFGIENISRFTSFKLENFRFIHASELAIGGAEFRSGIAEIGVAYQKYLLSESDGEIPFYVTSVLNQQLVALALEYI